MPLLNNHRATIAAQWCAEALTASPSFIIQGQMAFVIGFLRWHEWARRKIPITSSLTGMENESCLSAAFTYWVKVVYAFTVDVFDVFAQKPLGRKLDSGDHVP
jgi:hypothetical protein